MTVTIAPRPLTMLLNPAGLPRDPLLLDGAIVGWRWTWATAKGKYDKPPRRAADDALASVTNPDDHSDLATAIAAVQTHNWDGIGLVLRREMGLVGIDLDKCRDADTGEIKAWALAIIERFASYWEPSAIGTGIRIFIRGQLPPGRRRSGQIEVYQDGRYLTINGNPGPGASHRFEERQAELDAWYAEVFGTQQVRDDRPVAPIPATFDDTELLGKAFAAKNGRDFERRHQGTLILDNPSDDDWAYLMALAFWTQCNPGQMRRIALASGRVREKWLTRRPGGDWLDYNIAKACAEQHEIYDPQRLSGSRVVFTIPDEADVHDAAAIAAAVAERDRVIARLEEENERLHEKVEVCGRERERLVAENTALREERAAYRAALAYPDPTIGGSAWDIAREAFASRERGDVIVEQGKEKARVCFKTAAGDRSATTLSNATRKNLEAKVIDITVRKEQIATERFKGEVDAAYYEIPADCDTPAKFVLRLLSKPGEKKQGGARRKRDLPAFDEPVEGPIEIKTETKQIYREVATEKVLKVTPLETHTEYCDPQGFQLTIDEVNAFRESVGLKMKVPGYRPQAVPKQMALSETDADLFVREPVDLDDEAFARVIPIRGRRCRQPQCGNEPDESGFCWMHRGYDTMTGAD